VACCSVLQQIELLKSLRFFRGSAGFEEWQSLRREGGGGDLEGG